jgi:molecular chaperone DnaK
MLLPKTKAPAKSKTSAKMVNDAQANAAEDKLKREAVETKNQAEQQVHQTEKQLEEMGDKVSEESKAKVTEAVEKVKEALKGDNAESIKTANENLTQVWHAVASELYQQAAAEGEGAPGAEPDQEAPGADGADDSAVDAEFEVVDDEKK